MWKNIDPQYRTEASKLFQLVHGFSTSSAAAKTSFYLVYLHPITLFLATINTPSDAIKAPIQPLDTAKILREIDLRLRSRCLGLLEIDRRGPRVQFIHKTAREFIGHPSIWGSILAQTANTGFNVNLSLLSSYILQLKSWKKGVPAGAQAPHSQLKVLWSLVHGAMHFARLTERSTRESQTTLLDQLDRALKFHIDVIFPSVYDFSRIVLMEEGLDIQPFTPFSEMVPYKESHWSDLIPYYAFRRCPFHTCFLSFAIQHGLLLYVQSKLAGTHHQELPSKAGRPFLDYPLYVDDDRPGRDFTSTDMVETLLNHGANPNEIFNGRTPWQNVLTYLLQYGSAFGRRSGRKEIEKWGRMLELLILHNANPNACCGEGYTMHNGVRTARRCYSALRVVRRVFGVRGSKGSSNDHDNSSYDSGEDFQNFKIEDRKRIQFDILARLNRLLRELGGDEQEWYNSVLAYPSPNS
ncbi:hypothetical protein G7Y89_g5697 [Cudoniella acicularis]|uniref:DUF7791 domain-containing protein n=1 Tax=Cudoniella acicularis TaxID=354080 RepID=A0A8H4RNE0_9HELO|nr:hypothetical protein G7Y89_g5697 [Cudoniella acicularis]